MTTPGHLPSLVGEHDRVVGPSRPPGSSKNAAVFPTILGLTIGFAALIRAAHLGTKTLWSDEVASVVIAKLHWADFWRTVTTNEANMSLYYLLLRFWIHFGDQPSYVKFLSVLPGVAAVPVVYLIGREAFSRQAGLFAALLLSVNVFHIRYSQEARSYSLVVLLVALSFLSFFRCVKEQNHLWDVCHVLFSVLALYAHFFAALVLLAQAVSLVFLPRTRQLAGKQVQHFLIIAVLGGPLLWFVLFRNSGQLGWVHRPTAKDLYHFFLYMTGSGLKFGIALVSFAIALKAWASRAREQRTVQTWSFVVLMLWLFLPICITFFLSFWKPIFLARFLIVCLPAAMLLIASGLEEISQPWIRYSLVLMMLVSALAPIRTYYAELGPQDWKNAAGYVGQNASADDIAFLPNGYCEMPLRYYLDHAGKISTFPAIVPAAPDGTAQTIASYTNGHIWVISCGSPQPTLAISGYSAEKTRQFKGIDVIELRRERKIF
jgi:mannosyltransferase